jgi:hypothetical protein
MGFPTPTFAVAVNLWRGATIHTGPWPLPAPDETFNANLSYAKGRAQLAQYVIVSPGRIVPIIATELLCPKLTDIRGHVAAAFDGDLVEVPAGTNRLYAVLFVEDVGKTFANEYRLALILQLTSAVIGYTGYTLGGNYLWPQPTP